MAPGWWPRRVVGGWGPGGVMRAWHAIGALGRHAAPQWAPRRTGSLFALLVFLGGGGWVGVWVGWL